MDMLLAQFAKPKGLPGRALGRMMVLVNRPMNEWAVSLLDVQPTDRVLEIGFGPGAAIEAVAKRAEKGFVAGIDWSAVMVDQARSRNAAAVQSGRVELRQASVSELLYQEASFDKVYSVNSIPFWPDVVENLKSVLRVLKSGGRMVVAVQPRNLLLERGILSWAGGGPNPDAQVRELGEATASQMRQAGFREVRLEHRAMRPISAFAVVGCKLGGDL